jgi:hypothetical protein
MGEPFRGERQLGHLEQSHAHEAMLNAAQKRAKSVQRKKKEA